MEEGVIDSYHTLINPGALPLGMAYTAKAYAEETHKLPTPPKAQGEHHYQNIFQEIFDFAYDNENQDLMPIFTHQPQLDACKSLLNLFAEESGEKCDIFSIIDISNLLYLLKKATARTGQNMDGFATIHIAEAMIDRDQYEFHLNLGCELHEELDATKYCNLSQVKRWAYTICDHCCLDISVELIPGKHIPFESVLPRINLGDDDDDYDDDRKSTFTFASSSKFSASDFGGFNKIPKGFNEKYEERDTDQTTARSFEIREHFHDSETCDQFNDTTRDNYNDLSQDTRQVMKKHQGDRALSFEAADDTVGSSSRHNLSSSRLKNESADLLEDEMRAKKEHLNKWLRKDRVPEASFSTSKKDHDFYSFLK